MRNDPPGTGCPPSERCVSLTIGVDVGGTKVAAGVVDEAGQILAHTRLDTPPHNQR